MKLGLPSLLLVPFFLAPLGKTQNVAHKPFVLLINRQKFGSGSPIRSCVIWNHGDVICTTKTLLSAF
jgi:hypothetical protein